MISAGCSCSNFEAMMIDGKVDRTHTTGLNLWLITEAGNCIVCLLPPKQNALCYKHNPRGNASFRPNNVPWRLCLMHACWLKRYLSISVLKKRLRTADSQPDKYADSQQQSGRWVRQTGVGASWDVDEYITGTNIALLRHKSVRAAPWAAVLWGRELQQSSSYRAILIVFPLPEILNTQSSCSSWEPILDFYANVCQAGQTANHWIGDEM